MLERVQLSSGHKTGLAGAYDRLLKTLRFREKGGIESAQDAFGNALHKFKVALGTEDPTVVENTLETLEYGALSVMDGGDSVGHWLGVRGVGPSHAVMRVAAALPCMLCPLLQRGRLLPKLHAPLQH